MPSETTVIYPLESMFRPSMQIHQDLKRKEKEIYIYISQEMT